MSGLSRQLLLKLEAENRHVCHGSGLRLDCLRPRQAFTFRDGKYLEDGQPAIFASELVGYAIFMALINPQIIEVCVADFSSPIKDIPSSK